jgi:undecaprenyl-diphosphatase
MNIIETVILAIIQGISEFLPISSSAHLIIFRDIFLIKDGLEPSLNLAFDVALHFGTLLAIVVYFYKDFYSMALDGLTKGIKTDNGKLMWLIVLATIPGALAGLLFEDVIDSFFRSQYILISLTLALVGIAIYFIDKYQDNNKEIKELKAKDAIMIGIGQALALMPGFSRSGTTIAIARYLKIKRTDAAKFSFYLSVPIVLGATILMLIKEGTISLIASNLNIFVLGILISFSVGLITIKFLLNYLRKHDFKIFMWYRIILAIIALIFILF